MLLWPFKLYPICKSVYSIQFPALVTPCGTTAEIISAINRMVEQDFARQERAKYQEARTRYIQIRLSEVATSDTSVDGNVEGKEDEPKALVKEEEDGITKQESGESLPEEIHDSVFYSSSPCHVFRETTV